MAYSASLPCRQSGTQLLRLIPVLPLISEGIFQKYYARLLNPTFSLLSPRDRKWTKSATPPADVNYLNTRTLDSCTQVQGPALAFALRTS